MKNNNKRAFTLAEMLITMCIVGVLAVIVLPVLNNVFPNQEKMMFKKAYYLTEKVVSELVNDEDLYPEIDSDDQKPYLGNTVEVTYKGNKYSGDTKFCELFAARVNTASDIDCSSHSFSNNSVASSYTFKTSDGIVWDLPISSFSSETSPAVIQIDVNGDKLPNCTSTTLSVKPGGTLTAQPSVGVGAGAYTGSQQYQQGYQTQSTSTRYNVQGTTSTTGSSSSSTSSCSEPDRFYISVYQDGRILVEGAKEQEYLYDTKVSD